MKLYTRTGDDGKTHLVGGPRVAKDDPHIEACGTVDELNSLLGLVRTEVLPSDIDKTLHRIQHELFGIGADLATTGAVGAEMLHIGDQQVQQLEQEIDRYDATVPPLREFILPGGSRTAAMFHMARTVCRRAERRVVSLQSAIGNSHTQSSITCYLNRLADLLFALARVMNARACVTDENWRKQGS